MSWQRFRGEPLWKRVWIVMQVVVTVTAFLSFVWGALRQFGSIDAVVVGLLLIGASIGAGILGFSIGVLRVAERRRLHEALHRDRQRKSETRPAAKARPRAPRGEPTGTAPPAPKSRPAPAPPSPKSARRARRLSIGILGGRVGSVVLIAFAAAALLAGSGWLLITGSDECDGRACNPRPVWRYESVTGVGDTDGDGFLEVLAVAGDGTGTLLEMDDDGTVIEALETFHDWSSYDLIAGLGDVAGHSAPEIFVAAGEDGWILHRTSDGAWREDVDAEDFGRDWDYELVTVLQDVDDSGAPEVLGVNTVANGRTDDLMYIRPGGKYDPDEDRHETLQEEGDYDIVVGVGDIDDDGKQEVLAVIAEQAFLLTFDSDGNYDRTDLEGSWNDLDAVAGLSVFGDEVAPRVLRVRNGKACILTFDSLDHYIEKCQP